VKSLRFQEEKKENTSFDCKVCSKTYSSLNALYQHLNSKKHVDRTSTQDAKTSQDINISQKVKKPKSLEINQEQEEKVIEVDFLKYEPSRSLIQPAIPEEEQITEQDREIEEKIKNAKYFQEEECIFCNFKNSDFDSNLIHMSTNHGFFIPDIEYLKDVKGLIKYLGEKISVGNICIYCNGKGKTFHSLEAVQSHMRDQTHCKMIYEEENEAEYDEFYDFSESYSHHISPSNGEDEDVRQFVKGSATLADDGVHLVFSDGRTVGHRSFNIYYKQRYRPMDSRDAILINKLQNQYKQLGWTDTEKQNLVSEKQKRQELRKQEKRNLKISFKKNNQKNPNTQTAFL